MLYLEYVLIDWPESELRSYQGSGRIPKDFDAFWSRTLEESERVPLDVRSSTVDAGLEAIDVYDVTFAGAGGDPVKAWLRLPRHVDGPLPAVVQYVGYGGGRGHAAESLLWSAAGFAHLHMDTRGQGAGWSIGETPDPAGTGSQHPGVMTRGIQHPDQHYYRRLIVDAVRAVDAVRELPRVDPARVSVVGQSQGGGIALAVAGLRSDLASVVSWVPFLCDFPRAIRITDAFPYQEIVRYLAVHRGEAEAVLDTLSYFDGVNFASRASAPALFSAALMDATCPPSTVFAAHNRYGGDKRIDVWEFNGHEGGGIEDEVAGVRFVRSIVG